MRTIPSIILGLQCLVVYATPLSELPKPGELREWLDKPASSLDDLGQGNPNEHKGEIFNPKIRPSGALGASITQSIQEKIKGQNDRRPTDDVDDDSSTLTSNTTIDGTSTPQPDSQSASLEEKRTTKRAIGTYNVDNPDTALANFDNIMAIGVANGINPVSLEADMLDNAARITGPLQKRSLDKERREFPPTNANHLNKRIDYSDFDEITSKMNLNAQAQAELKAVFRSQTIVSNLQAYLNDAEHWIGLMVNRVPACAKEAYKVWANDTAASQTRIIIPVFSADGNLTQVDQDINQQVTLPPQGSQKQKRQSSNSATFGDADADAVMTAVQNLITDVVATATRIVSRFQAANPAWQGMNTDAKFTLETYVLGVIGQNLNNALQRRPNALAAKIYQNQVNGITTANDAQDLGQQQIDNSDSNIASSTTPLVATATTNSMKERRMVNPACYTCV